MRTKFMRSCSECMLYFAPVEAHERHGQSRHDCCKSLRENEEEALVYSSYRGDFNSDLMISCTNVPPTQHTASSPSRMP